MMPGKINLSQSPIAILGKLLLRRQESCARAALIPSPFTILLALGEK